MKPTDLWRAFTIFIVIAFLAACAPAATQPPPAAPATEPPAVVVKTEEPKVVEPTKPAEPPTEAVAAPTEAPEKPAGPSVLRIAIPTTVDMLDPHTLTSFAVGNIIDYMAEPLVKADVNGKIIPWLAESWEISEDRLLITFHLRKGVDFSDGTPFNAEAVKYNVERFLDKELKNTKNPYDRIVEVTVVDDYTVTFRLEKPSSEIVPAMSNTNVAMVSPASVAKGTEAYLGTGTKGPVGTGPYVFKDFQVDDQVVVERNPNYWGEAPYYDEVVFRIVPEAATRESMLLAGQVDIALLPPFTDLENLKNNPDVKLILGESARIIFTGINTQKVKDVKIRQALNYAVDKEAIVKYVLLGNGVLVDSPMPRSFFGYCKTTPAYDYDPEKAKALLAEAGVADGLELLFYTPSGRYAQDYQVAEAIAGYLADVGVNATLETMDWGSYMAQVMSPAEEAKHDLYLLGWSGSYPHGSHTMGIIQSHTLFNNGYYTNPEVDELILKADAALTDQQSEDYYCQANQIVWEDAAWIFLYTQSYPVIHSSNVTGIVILPSEKFDTSGAHPAD